MRSKVAWAGVTFALLMPCLAKAEEAPPPTHLPLQWRLDSTIYAEFGQEVSGSGDDSQTSQERTYGFGVGGTVLGLDSSGSPTSNGAVLFFGAATEESWRKLIHCGEWCGSKHLFDISNDSAFGARIGSGWDFRWVGFRAGVAVTRNSETGTSVFPDLELTVGPLDLAYFNLGIGAYDAQTTVRPGVYTGFGVVMGRGLSATVHAGVHTDQDWIAFRYDATLDYRLTRALSLGLGVALQSSGAYQGHLSLSVGHFN